MHCRLSVGINDIPGRDEATVTKCHRFYKSSCCVQAVPRSCWYSRRCNVVGHPEAHWQRCRRDRQLNCNTEQYSLDQACERLGLLRGLEGAFTEPQLHLRAAQHRQGGRCWQPAYTKQALPRYAHADATDFAA